MTEETGRGCDCPPNRCTCAASSAGAPRLPVLPQGYRISGVGDAWTAEPDPSWHAAEIAAGLVAKEIETGLLTCGGDYIAQFQELATRVANAIVRGAYETTEGRVEVEVTGTEGLTDEQLKRLFPELLQPSRGAAL